MRPEAGWGLGDSLMGWGLSGEPCHLPQQDQGFLGLWRPCFVFSGAVETLISPRGLECLPLRRLGPKKGQGSQDEGCSGGLELPSPGADSSPPSCLLSKVTVHGGMHGPLGIQMGGAWCWSCTAHLESS